MRNKFLTEGNIKRAAAVQGIIHLFGSSFDSMVDNIEGKLANTNINAGLELTDGERTAELAAARKKLLGRFVQDIASDGATETPEHNDGATAAPSGV